MIQSTAMPEGWTNRLYFGDNLNILRDYIRDESVDLIYLDPPFNSQATYNVLFAEKSGEKSAAQITAFEDTWQWGLESESAYHELVTSGQYKVSELIQAFRAFLKTNDMMAYLTMIAIRLLELRRVLKPTGSIYLHCDPTASHYLKLLLDAAFDVGNFRSEVIWKRTSAHSSARRYGPVHDVIFFYSKSGEYRWNQTYASYDEGYLDTFFDQTDADGKRWKRTDLTGSGVRHGETGMPWRGIDVTAKGRHWMYPPTILDEMDAKGRIHWPKKTGGMPRLKQYPEDLEGVPLQDVWTDIRPMHNLSRERLGYPTQKPEMLLERILKASSNPDDVFLDPFCGCGTSIAVAERLHRRWLGIDITHLAIALMRHRLHDSFGAELSEYEVVGDPKDLEGARALAQGGDRYKFQQWAVGLVDAFPGPKGADKGIDGVIKFFDDNSGKAKTILVQVKSGHASSRDIRDLKGVLERDKATMGAFITLDEPSQPMLTEAASAGFYEPGFYPGRRYPKVQILTIADLLGGMQLEYPMGMGTATFKRAVRKPKRSDEQDELF